MSIFNFFLANEKFLNILKLGLSNLQPKDFYIKNW